MSKNTYRVGTDGTANYATLTEIPTSILLQGDNTILVYPGSYTALTDAVLTDLSIIGVGSPTEVVISGDTTIANTSSGTITFENLTFTGSNAAVTSGSVAVSKLGLSETQLRFKNCIFNGAEYAIAHHGVSGTTDQIVLDYCDAQSVDKTLIANANVGINFSALNSSANAYFTPGTGGGTAAMGPTVRASTSGGSNTGLNTETVLALIS